VDEGQVVGREFVVARCDPTTLLDLVEEAFDEIARSIKVWTEADRLVAILFGGMFAQAPLLMASSLIQSAS
jgi:hypothetical protein